MAWLFPGPVSGGRNARRPVRARPDTSHFTADGRPPHAKAGAANLTMPWHKARPALSDAHHADTTTSSISNADTLGNIHVPVPNLHAAIIAFDITPRFHPTCGAWGCNPTVTGVSLPLLGRCLVLQTPDTRVIWFSFDLVGDDPSLTFKLRQAVAARLDLTADDILWGTCQNHSCGAPPWSRFTGAVTADLSTSDPNFRQQEHDRFIQACADAARSALDQLQPVTLHVGRGHCDAVSFNTRLALPDGTITFCRHHEHARHGPNVIDPTIALLRFDDMRCRPIAAVLNFNMHLATMINSPRISSDWLGTTRSIIEDALDGRPLLFCQGFCSDVNCHHLFGTHEDAADTGARLAQAALDTLPRLIPARSLPLTIAHRTVEMKCQPMPSRDQWQQRIDDARDFIDRLQRDPRLTFGCGINLPPRSPVHDKIKIVESQLAYLRAAIDLLDRGAQPRTSLTYPISALRIGDVAAAFAPGENFAATGIALRQRSPFLHTLIGGDINGLFGNIFPDYEIAAGACSLDSYYEILELDGFRLPPAPGTADQYLHETLDLLQSLI